MLLGGPAVPRDDRLADPGSTLLIDHGVEPGSYRFRSRCVDTSPHEIVDCAGKLVGDPGDQLNRHADSIAIRNADFSSRDYVPQAEPSAALICVSVRLSAVLATAARVMARGS